MVNDTLHVRPEDGSTQWSTRTMAIRHGIGKDTVAKIWRKHDLKPWKIDTFKVSNDPDSRPSWSMWSVVSRPARAAVVFSSTRKPRCRRWIDPAVPAAQATPDHDPYYKRNAPPTCSRNERRHRRGPLYTRKSHTAKTSFFFKLIDLHVPPPGDPCGLDNLSLTSASVPMLPTQNSPASALHPHQLQLLNLSKLVSLLTKRHCNALFSRRRSHRSNQPAEH